MKGFDALTLRPISLRMGVRYKVTEKGPLLSINEGSGFIFMRYG
jgi:hypothetical protein